MGPKYTSLTDEVALKHGVKSISETCESGTNR